MSLPRLPESALRSPVKIERLQDRLRQLVINLDHVDATIHLFDPSIELQEIRYNPSRRVIKPFRGEVSRIVLTALRNAKKPLTTPRSPSAS